MATMLKKCLFIVRLHQYLRATNWVCSGRLNWCVQLILGECKTKKCVVLLIDGDQSVLRSSVLAGANEYSGRLLLKQRKYKVCG